MRIQAPSISWSALRRDFLTAIAALLVVIVHPHPRARSDAVGEHLYSALDELQFRPFAGRLTGQREYRPFRPRSGAFRTYRLRVASAEVTRTAANDSYLRGVALLVDGRATDAAKVLEEAAAGGGTADLWSDLAATLLAAADASGSGEAAVDALAAATRAIEIDPGHPPAHFNRMLTLNRLGLRTESAAEARLYTTLDGTSPWSDETRRFSAAPRSLTAREAWEAALPRLEENIASGAHHSIDSIVRQFPQSARAWGEGVLLAEWADATVEGRRDVAARALRLASAVGDSLARTSGESLLVDACAAVEAAIAGTDRDRVELLATAHRLYRAGRIAHRDNEHRRAEELFRRASDMFSQADSPMKWVSSYYVGSSLYFQFRIQDAIRKLDGIDRDELQRRGYRALCAQIGWERGLCELVCGSVSNAISILTTSQQSFASLGETENAATLNTLLAEALDFVDNPDAGWNLRRTALPELSAAGNETRKLIALTSAADDRIRREQWPRACALLDVAVDIAVRIKHAELVPYVLAKRSVVRVHLGDDRLAAEDLREGQKWMRRLSEPSAHRRAEAELAVAESVQSHVDTPSALAALDRAAAYYEDAAPAYLPPVLLERARLRSRADDRAGARRDLLAGISTLEQHRAAVAGLSQRATMFATGDALFNEAIAMDISSLDIKSAFELSERARARAILDGMQLISGPALPPPSLDRIQNALAHQAAIVTYVTANARVTAIVVRKSDLTAVDLGSETTILKLAMRLGRPGVPGDAEGGVTLASDLHELIVGPLRSALVGVKVVAWIPNDTLRGIPFAALYDRHRDRFIVEDYLTVEAPSAAVAVEASRRAGVPDKARALVVGAISFDRQRFPELDPIAAATGEAHAVADLRSASALLIGEDANRTSVLKALDEFSILHFAGHVVPGRTPGDAELVVAATKTEPGSVDARTIAELRLPKMRLAVLTACRSATVGGRGDGPESIAAAFLMAGVPTVVATPWPVEDRASASFAERFHRSLLGRTDPAAAVRDVLRQQARNGTNLPRDPSQWAAFRAIGGTKSLVTEQR